MGVTVAVTRVACNTSTGDQTITTTDLGGLTPKAAMFIITQAVTDGAAANHAVWGLGFTDGTTSFCSASEDEHGLSTTDTQKGGAAVPVVIMDGAATNTVDGQADFSAWVTNGSTITWTNAPSTGFLLTVVYFAGTDLTVDVGW
ncbi:MAG: hypothetical protein HC804_02175 [Anaerolineae bacterium]|nr:hypothetical protein [Anaerolineae bacterium]